MEQRNTVVRGLTLAVVLGLAAVLGLSACSGDEQAARPGGGAPPPPAVAVQAQPADGAQDVAPADPVQVSVDEGSIESVTLTNPDGKQVAGEPGPDNRTWATTEPLGYGKTYTWAGAAVGTDGKKVPIAGSFTTVTPSKHVSGSLNVGDDQTYGVAMPIGITFDSKITDKVAVEKALTVETTPQTEGSWAWLENDTAVHWRPKEYWQPGTQVRVEAKLYGQKLGAGVYGESDVSANFEIGRSQVVKGNTQTHRMQIVRDGEQIADYAVSYGLDGDPGRVTRSGTHVVMGKHDKYFMNNPGYGYEDFEVNWAVRISNNGEFTHAAPWSVGQQGASNVSHGCINMSDADAKAYFDSVLTGDPVEIEGSTQELGPKDGAYHDWTYSWEDWTAKSALNS